MVRPALAEDAGRLARLHATAFDRGWSAAAIADLLATGASGAVVEDAGFILWRTIVGEAEILTLAVEPSFRRQGHGRALVCAAMAGAADEGASEIFLEVADDNAAAQGLYYGLGFLAVGERPDYYVRPSGEMRDALIFRRALNSDKPFSL